ncbi:hypothetical protein SAMN02745225_00512 [Ferrithrix thermotolerans DSM 19514]|uniref:Cytochrome aa3 subunit 3 n=1 Tax=Ferrithrix thermotolerans DSM 19514 TaxID=1121881 RepID=A0A1M4T5K2_9ACTN|nr:hypothetical protein [Ferrithrix thermotolerans]SHE39832.1 hypothetical protein SAMN02745225_00512 [Ferrithrix thermotolerans DSM 19514]
MASNVDERPVIDEEAYYHDASLGATWTASRTAVAMVATLYGGIAFAFFYLRSLNSNGQWNPNHITASTIIGTTILVLMVVAALVNYFGARRLRRGMVVDWQVAAAFTALFVLVAGGMQIWELTRLPFQPSSFGYASVFVAFGPVNAFAILLSAYWAETAVMQSVRIKKLAITDGGLGLSSLPVAEKFRANVDGLSFFLNGMALITIVFYVIFYVIA